MRSFLIIGMGRFGSSTARTLAALGHEVLAVDRSEERIEAIKDDVLHAVTADTSEERVLASLGISNFDCVVICVGDDLRSSILTTVLCKELGAKRIVAKAQDDLHAKILLKTGADQAVQPEHDGGVRLARSLASESIIDSLGLSEEYSVQEIHVPEKWIGKSLVGLNVRVRYGVSVIALRRDGHLQVNVNANAPLQPGDTLFILGDNKDLERLDR